MVFSICQIEHSQANFYFHSLFVILFNNNTTVNENLGNLRRLVKFCLQELYDIDVCIECYRNANECGADWFTLVCTSPHILIWARVGNERKFWPAKAMAVKRTAYHTRIHVRFFGFKARNAFIEPSECYLYSAIDPNCLMINRGNRLPVSHFYRLRALYFVHQQFWTFSPPPLYFSDQQNLCLFLNLGASEIYSECAIEIQGISIR